MPRVASREYFGGSKEKVARLGLQPLWNELEAMLTGFDLRVLEQKDGNGGAAVRAMLDARFEQAGGWTKKQSGGVDWSKCLTVNGTRVCMGVEIQFSARSDLLIMDVAHLREAITRGDCDVGVIVVPSDRLGIFLTDRGPDLTSAQRAIRNGRAEDLPLALVALDHDGAGPSLPKRPKGASGAPRIRTTRR